MRARTALTLLSAVVWLQPPLVLSQPPPVLSQPPPVLLQPPPLQAAWVSRALHRLWVAGAGLVTWQFLIDPYPALRLANPTGPALELSRPAGLYSAGMLDGRSDPALAQPKPFLQGFAFPFDPLRVDSRHVRVWALLSRSGQAVQLQRKSRTGKWRTIAHLRADSHGFVNAFLPLTGPASLRLLSGGVSSASALVALTRSAL